MEREGKRGSLARRVAVEIYAEKRLETHLSLLVADINMKLDSDISSSKRGELPATSAMEMTKRY